MTTYRATTVSWNAATASFVESSPFDVPKGKYAKQGLDISVLARATLELDDPEGTRGGSFPPGQEVRIYKSGVEDYRGIVESRRRKRSGTEERVTLNLVSYFQHTLRARVCTEDFNHAFGQAYSFRRNVRRNPWRPFIYRHPDGTPTNSAGYPMALDGITIDQMALAIIGAAYVFQHEFLDGKLSNGGGNYSDATMLNTSNPIGVYAESQSGDNKPALQLCRKTVSLFYGDGIFTVGSSDQHGVAPSMGWGEVNNQALANGVQSLAGQVILLGDYNGFDPTFTFNGVTITLARTANYLGSGLSAWIGTIPAGTLAAGQRNPGFTIRLNSGGATTSATTKVHYLRIFVPFAKGYTRNPFDTYNAGGIPYSVDAYYDPDTLATTGETVWVEDDFSYLDAIAAMERLRRSTRSKPSLNPNPYWDAWFETDGTFNFKPRRGAATTKTFTVGDGTLDGLDMEETGESLPYEVLVLGNGRGASQAYIRTNDPYVTDAGWMEPTNKPMLPPSDSGFTYQGLPRQVIFRDTGNNSRANILRQSRAWFDANKVPLVKLRPSFVGFADVGVGVGDSATFMEPSFSLNAMRRCIGQEFAWSGEQGERAAYDFQDPFSDLASELRRQSEATKRATVSALPLLGTLPPGSDKVYFDAATPSASVFTVPVQGNVERVFLYIQVIPWEFRASGGVTMFKGDTPGSNPVYGEVIMWAVDPASPTSFTASEQVPIVFGQGGTPGSILIEVTKFLREAADTNIAPGPHRVVFQGVAATNNSGGKAAVNVTPIFIQSEVKG